MTENEKPEEPVYQQYINLIKNKTPPGGSTAIALRIIREEIEPQIMLMTQAQLIEAFTEAIYAIHDYERFESVLASTIEQYKEGSLTLEMTAQILQKELEIAPGKTRKETSKKAIQGRYGKVGGLWEKKTARARMILETWASGKYPTRDECAEEEYRNLGYGSFKNAREALRNSADPSPWPAKKKKNS